MKKQFNTLKSFLTFNFTFIIWTIDEFIKKIWEHWAGSIVAALCFILFEVLKSIREMSRWCTLKRVPWVCNIYESLYTVRSYYRGRN